MSGMDKLLNLINNDIPECRKNLQDSHVHLANVANFCEGNYAKALDKQQALEETKSYMTQSLASVAYQINMMSSRFLQLLDLQVEQVSEIESCIDQLSQAVSIHKEKVARREIGELTSSKNLCRPAGVKGNGVILPDKPEQAFAYVRKPIDFSSLDNLGISKQTTVAAPLNHAPSVRASKGGITRPDIKPPPEPIISNLPLPPPLSPDIPLPSPLPPSDRLSTIPDSPALPPPPPSLDEDESFPDLPELPPPLSSEEEVVREDFASRMSRMMLDDASWIPTDFIEKVVAVYSYSQDKDDELSFVEGAIIYVVRKNEDGWWEGAMDGQTGLFPNNYVEPCI